MEKTETGMSWIGVLFIILVIWAVFGGGFGNGFGWGNRGGCTQEGGCNRVSNCQIEKNEIIDSARTQFLIEQQSAATRTAVRDGTDAVMAQNSRIYEQRLQETIFDLKAENMQLKNNAFVQGLVTGLEKKVDDCCCGFNRRLDSIECNMLTKPNLSGVASTCNGQLVPALFRNDCGNCCNNT